MTIIRYIKGRILKFYGKDLLVVEMDGYCYEGRLCLYSSTFDLQNVTRTIYNYLNVAFCDQFLFFQEKDSSDILFVNILDLNTCNSFSGSFNIRKQLYKGQVVIIDDNDDSQFYAIDMLTKSVKPTGFGLDLIFDITNELYGIIYCRNNIRCYRLDSKIMLWEINTKELEYDRGGRHMDNLTPKNDVPYRCLFFGDLLIALFRTHSAGIDLYSGNVVWEHNIGSEYRGFLDDGILYLNQGAYFYKLNAASGIQLFENCSYEEVNDSRLFDRKTNLVFNDSHIYFCLCGKKEVVVMNKETFEVESIAEIVDNRGGVLHASEPIYLKGDKLFVTLEYSLPLMHTEILVCQI